MEVFFFDRQVLVVWKPKGVVTQTQEGKISLQEMVRGYLADKEGKVRPFVEPIHRLDQPTEGLVIFARTSKSLSRLQASLREGKVKKWYWALLEGHMPKEEAVLRHCLVKRGQKAFVEEGGKHSVLSYKTYKKHRERHEVVISLATGRYHQIRAQFASEGHPLVGDRKYGAKSVDEELMLAHIACSFPHPITQLEVLVKSDQSLFLF